MIRLRSISFTPRVPRLAPCRPRPQLRPHLPVVKSSASILPAYRALHATSPSWAISPFKLHDIGEGITEVEIIKWYVTEGQEVNEFDALCEVQSDKSVVELTSHANGIVKGIKRPAGEVVKVGQVLCEIHTAEDDQPDEGLSSANSVEDEQTQDPSRMEETNEEVEKAEEATEALEKTEERQDDQSSEDGVHSQNTEYPAPDNERHHDPIQLSGEASILPSPPRPKNDVLHQQVEPRKGGDGMGNSRRSIIKTSPSIRTLAAKLGVDLSDIQGTGEGGRITKFDLENHNMTIGSQVNTQSHEAGLEINRSKIPESTKVEFGRTRKIMFRALGEQGKIPHFGYSHTLDLTPLLPYIKAANPAPTTLTSSKAQSGYIASDIPLDLVRDPLREHKQKTTLLSFLVKGLILALEEHPVMRSKLKDEGNQRWLEIARDGVIGVAVSDPKYGLLTPSLPPLPPSTSLSSITAHLRSLRGAPNKPSTPANITISSVGGLGEAINAMPILPPGGGVAICAVGRAKWQMEWDLANGSMEPKRSVWEMDANEVQRGGTRAVLRVPVGWSGDHRILEGAELIAFTETWKKYIEEPWRWINVVS
ncbi:uncharacterized protein I303_100139 [Kwoniella dejecticola CBS 10117]|uniref:Dihydrolipoamide acetyltransferase component of pyruvate dehydrogenase complex n=1 Tax=Kwoniella dejecticola CBS 10117 TaxID=1296121 RepID=A0A1A6AE77_9TREE|nr:uncharacterized protein I303_00139 [Kwoniella dejecticola CBS 10117]OBR88328.1 hypothetical protein I303_00139 [Kwoniella dejecticola CBS 10117]